MIHYHGTPITPRSVLMEMAGRCFCVSFSEPRDVETCHSIGQSVMLDNGAFSFWRTGLKVDWDAYMDWVDLFLDHPTTWAVIPDVIDGTDEENDRLLVRWFQRRLPKGAPVWHLHEPLGRLKRLCAGYERVCFGSSGAYATIGSERWHRRVTEAFNAISDPSGRVPWIHMLRGMSLSGGEYPFGSVDSTDIARNHNRTQNIAWAMADRWDSMQSPGRWKHRGDQLELEEA